MNPPSVLQFYDASAREKKNKKKQKNKKTKNGSAVTLSSLESFPKLGESEESEGDADRRLHVFQQQTAMSVFYGLAPFTVEPGFLGEGVLSLIRISEARF